MSEKQIENAEYSDLLSFFDQKNWSKKLAQTKDQQLLKLKSKLINLTSFLPSDAVPAQREWHIRNNILEPIMCSYCKHGLVKFTYQGYGKYCSPTCAGKSPESQKKVRQTNKEKYGVEFLIHCPELREKMEATNKEKYGGISSMSSEEIRAKAKHTIKKLYGSEIPFENEHISQKRSDTMVQKYGSVHALQNETVLQKMHDTMLDRYNVEHALQSEHIYNKRTDTCKLLYGKDFFKQKHITDENLNKSNDPAFLEEQHHKNKKTVAKIAEELNISATTLSNRFDDFDIEKKKFYFSMSQLEIVDFLSESGFEAKMNERKVLWPRELDIYIASHNFAIEYNGLRWHNELYKDKNYHQEKYLICKSKGIRLIQIFEDEWIEKKQLIKEKLIHLLGKSQQKKIFARACKIVNVVYEDKTKFFEETHIQGDGKSSLNFGLLFADELVAVMSFCKRSDDLLELSRYSTKYNVVGGFSKLLSHFDKVIKKDIVTFADLRWSNGALYENNGFNLVETLKPDYAWVKNYKRFHKFNFRHSRMKNKLDKYDQNLTEVENMHNNNYYRIYDAGKLKYYRKAIE